MNANTTDTLRLFFALWPDDATRTALQQLQASIRGRLIPYNNLHLTLAFLGVQPETLLADAKDLLAHLSTPTAPVLLNRVGYFARNRIAWIGMHQVPAELIALEQELSGALKECGIAIDSKQNFKPHITLARDAEPPPDIAFTPIPWRCSHVALVQSVTKPEGATYELIASRSLNERPWLPDESGGNGTPVK
ncbi:MAG TPA: RNA 2',3'-cyclic phosphodiesterase [Noviherbaspirillum sp.]|nr:RNA 2',3'-cyclic phosphodiesterase [Noviherbaspirillum sp.]